MTTITWQGRGQRRRPLTGREENRDDQHTWQGRSQRRRPLTDKEEARDDNHYQERKKP